MNTNIKPGYIFAGILTLLCLSSPNTGPFEMLDIVFLYLIFYVVYMPFGYLFKLISSIYKKPNGGENDYGSKEKDTGTEASRDV